MILDEIHLLGADRGPILEVPLLSYVFVVFLFCFINLFSLSISIMDLMFSGHCIKNAIHFVTNRTFNSICRFINSVSKCSVCLNVMLLLLDFCA